MQSNSLLRALPFSDKKLISLIQAEEVVLTPSDTVWGLCGKVTDKVFDKLNFLKVRNEKPYLLLASSLKDIEQYAVLPQDQALRDWLMSIWPGPVTVIFKALPSTPSYMIGPEKSIAFRIPYHEGLQSLLASVSPLFSTSANISGQPVPLTFNQVDHSIKKGVAAYVGIDEISTLKPSTIVDVSNGTLKLVREGIITFDQLKNLLEEKRENNMNIF